MQVNFLPKHLSRNVIKKIDLALKHTPRKVSKKNNRHVKISRFNGISDESNE